jgi:hypothetical protein
MKKIFLILTIVFLIAGVGCKKGYLDVNTNPNQSTSADPSLVLPAALAVTVANYYPGTTAVSEWMGSWAVSGSYAINASDAGTTYKMTTDFGDGLWQSIYDNLEDYQYIQNKANATGQPFLEGVARIMKAFNYQHLVDLWSDVPYADALKGGASLRPAYSKGQDIYDSLFIEIQRGITLIKGAPTTVNSNSDIMFGGDKDSWIQFANTVRLNMLLRMSEMATKPDFFQPNLDLTKNESAGFLTKDALVNPGYVNSTGKGNPFWQRFWNLTGGQVSSFGDFWAPNIFAVNFYQNNKDPRLGREFTLVPSGPNKGKFIGNLMGAVSGNPSNGNYSFFGPGILRGYDIAKDVNGFDSAYTVNPTSGSTAPAVMMLAAESYFLQAEAVVLGYLPGDDKSLYESGVTASFEYLGAQEDLKKAPDSNNIVRDSVRLSPDVSATRYYSQSNSNVNYSSATTPLAKQTIILRQKWAALNSINSLESYADYRRFDYLHTGTAPYTGPLGNTPLTASPYYDVNKIPIRWKYPTTEYSRNPDNVSKEGTIDHQVTKIWWMK